MNVPVEEVDLDELSSGAVLLQSPEWARFKADFGWEPHALRPTDGPWAGVPLSVLMRRLGPGFSLAYVPHAPALRPSGDHRAGGPPPVSALSALGSTLAAALGSAAMCVRFDLPWPASASPRSPRDGQLRKAPVDVQPASTVLIDLEPDPDQLLAAMHKKNRYNIRLAMKKGVGVRRGDSEDLARWYSLYEETAERDRITIHPIRYYRQFFAVAERSEELHADLYLAEHDGDVLAGIIVARYRSVATYLYGASSNTKRNLMPNYALQWEAIQASRAAGAKTYDLFGVPPADDPAHPMHGLYRFKTGFGGRVIHRAGSWDKPVRPLRYQVYRFAERGRTFYFHTMRKSGAR